MTTTNSDFIDLVMPDVGSEDGTWGTLLRTIWNALSRHVGGYISISAAGSGTLTLTTDQNRHQTIEFTGALTGAKTIEIAANVGLGHKIIKNNTTGSETLTVLVSGQTGVVIPQGYTQAIHNPDGTDVVALGPPVEFSEQRFGTLILETIFTVGDAQTWNRQDGAKWADVQCQGGGGGGGGSASSAGQLGVGGAGGGGGYCRALIDISAITSATIDVGAGGAAGASGANAGSVGTDTDFNSTALVANGGSGGSAGTSSLVVRGQAGSAGGTATGGDINMAGGGGHHGSRFAVTQGLSGNGGDSFMGTGGLGVANDSTGNAGNNYGGGGSGGASDNGLSRAGGAGADGICIVREYA